jgi:ethanolamine utilization protein EutN
MQLGTVIGHVTSTVKHPTLSGWRLLIVQPLDAIDEADGAPLVVIDNLGSRRGDRVMISSDGASIREMIGSKTSPARFAVIGVTDD